MPRGLDHLVLAVHDHDRAGRFYEALGFTVGARNRHPWGTENRIVQFPGVFLELITVGEGAEIAPHAPGHFSFGAFVRDSLAKGEGFAMLALESHDAAADRAAFAAERIGDFETFFFERTALRPDGSPKRVAFSLTFAEDRLAPKAGFFVCQQHAPENFWNPDFQRHPNGAAGVPGVIMVAENPSAHAEFFTHFSGQHDIVSNSAGIEIPTPRGVIQVMSGAALAFHTGLSLPEEPARLVGFRVAVDDVETQAARLTAADIPFTRHEGTLVVASEAAHGTALVFQRA
jgi:hypothetical protein